MKIVILTVDRKPNYIHACIKSIRNEYKGKIDLMIGGTNYDYVKKYDKGFVKHFVKEDDLTENYHKACRGYSECLKLGEREGVLIIEDDTVMRKGWYKQFLSYIGTIQDPQYVLSLGDAMPGSVTNPSVKVPTLQQFLYRINLRKNPGTAPVANIICWYDSHAVFYPPTLDLKELSAYMEHFGVKHNSMHDLIIGYYMYRRLIQIYLAVPALAKNVGAYNTHVGPVKNLNNDYSDWDYSLW